jgi:hypothetical protein
MNVSNYLLNEARAHENVSYKKRYINNTLILNSDYTPLSIVSTFRSLTLQLKERIEPVHFHDSEYIHGLTSSYQCISVGRIKRRYVKMDSYYVPYARKLVLKRDGHKCVYCGSSKSLTIDHVVPISKGGESSWDNTVASCWKCNNAKGEMNLSEFMDMKGFTHKIQPFKPHQILLMINGNLNNIPDTWRTYLFLKK